MDWWPSLEYWEERSRFSGVGTNGIWVCDPHGLTKSKLEITSLTQKWPSSSPPHPPLPRGSLFIFSFFLSDPMLFGSIIYKRINHNQVQVQKKEKKCFNPPQFGWALVWPGMVLSMLIHPSIRINPIWHQKAIENGFIQFLISVFFFILLDPDPNVVQSRKKKEKHFKQF